MSDKLSIVLDASMYDMFRLCEQRFDYRYNLNLIQRPSGFGKSTTSPLDKGNMIHAGCESYYESLRLGTDYSTAVGIAEISMRSSAAVNDFDDDDIRIVLDTMEEYFDYWRFEDQLLTINAVEQPFMYLLYEDEDIKIFMSGKIDILFSKDSYINAPMDHKSFSRSGPVNDMSNQFKNYCNFTKSNILMVNRIGLQKTLKPHEKFLRVPVSYDYLILEQWKVNVVKVCKYYVSCAVNESWSMNETSCDKFNRKCDYLELCRSSGAEAIRFKIENNFVKTEPWDVTKVFEKTSETIKKAQLEKEKVQ